MNTFRTFSLMLLGTVLVWLPEAAGDRDPRVKDPDRPVGSQAFIRKGGAGKGNGGGLAGYQCDAGQGVLGGYTEPGCPAAGIYDYTLWAGKTNNAGTVAITHDVDHLYVNCDTNGTADLQEVHVHVWTDLEEIPDRRPIPGSAPYAARDIVADSVTLAIPLALSDGDKVYLAIHAALVTDGTVGDDEDDGTLADNAGETAYAGGSNVEAGFPDGSGAWWGYVTYVAHLFYDVSGTVYDDADNSGEQGEDETGLAGVGVRLTPTSPDEEIIETVTDSDGNFLFEHIPAGSICSVLVTVPEGYTTTENADGYDIAYLADCESDINFGLYQEADDPDEPGTGGDDPGTGALSHVAFATGCDSTIVTYSNSNSDFVYEVETDYQQETGNIKFNAEGDQLGEDGVRESDTFTFEACPGLTSIVVTTKNKTSESRTFTEVGESQDMGNGFTVTWVESTAEGTYSFTVESDDIGGGGN